MIMMQKSLFANELSSDIDRQRGVSVIHDFH